jgi:hypothetical protein
MILIIIIIKKSNYHPKILEKYNIAMVAQGLYELKNNEIVLNIS